MLIRTPRFMLRDFVEADRRAFVAYQSDPRYLQLYDGNADNVNASGLFDRFLSWQNELPRQNFQVGIFEPGSGRLCGCAGIRKAGADAGAAVLGIELTPDDWGRYRLAIEVATALIGFGFDALGLDTLMGSTASGNVRVDKLARWFGAEIVARHPGPPWMTARGWSEVDWALTRASWARRGD